MSFGKTKKCKYCKERFEYVNSFQPFCFKEECIKAHNMKIKEKKSKQIKKEFKESDKSTLLKLAEKVVNTYIRLRDKNKPCCSCGHFGDRQFHAGHYMNVGGHQQLRFYTLNIHKQCSICNNWKSSNNQQYRPFMINKYGLEFVESLESNNERGHYTVEYLQRLIKVFRKKIKLYESKFR